MKRLRLHNVESFFSLASFFALFMPFRSIVVKVERVKTKKRRHTVEYCYVHPYPYPYITIQTKGMKVFDFQSKKGKNGNLPKQSQITLVASEDPCFIRYKPVEYMHGWMEHLHLVPP